MADLRNSKQYNMVFFLGTHVAKTTAAVVCHSVTYNSFVTPWTAARQASCPLFPGVCLTRVRWVSDAIQPSCPLPPPSIFPRIRVFSSELALGIRWLKYWSFTFSISPSNDYSELVCFRIDWFDLLAVQGTIKSFLLYCSSKASIIWHSSFFTVQLSHLYMTTRKPIALTICTTVSNGMSLLFNILSRFLKVFLPSSKYLLTV